MAVTVKVQFEPVVINAPCGCAVIAQTHGGYLELVRDTVNAAMTSMLAAGQSINQAPRYFTNAETTISQARYKDAFEFLPTAYRELTK